tara:strand:- start:111 stop:479 length:369 start_codon:yes stop_codon:yes gene_type:complete
MFGKIKTKLMNMNNKIPFGFNLAFCLIFLSNKNKTTKHIKKYTAAYLAKKAKPKQNPSKRKYKFLGLFLIFKSRFSKMVHKSKRITSVEIINEERLTAGIIKKIIAQEKESTFSNPSFSQRK